MYFVLIIVAIIVCVLLGFIVLIQNPKGGGLTSSFSSSSQLMGVQKTGDILEKGTWVLAITLMVLSLAINVSIKSSTVKGGAAGSNEYQNQIEKASKPTAPVSPLQMPTAAPAPAKKDAAKK